MSGCENCESNIKTLLSLEDLLEATCGVHVLGAGDFHFTSVQTDSRNVQAGTLFVPLIGEVQDGHKYVPQAVESGASVVFVCMKNFEADSAFFVQISMAHPDVYFVAVENTLTALQKAAQRYVEKFPSLIKVAVTGSSGKTTTKEIAASILAKKYSVITNKGNFNSETGLPLSVFNIRAEHQLGLFEMGMNRENEIGEIAAVLKPMYAIVTNIGTAHIGNLGSRENIAREKSKVFTYLNSFGTGVIPKDDDFASFMADQIDGHVVYYGDGCDEDVKFIQDKGLDGTEFSVGESKVTLSLPGKYNYKNALGAIALAKVLGLTDAQIAEGLSDLKPMFGRSEVLHGKYTIVQDCYNANPDSMEKAIEFVGSVTADVKKILVLGDMLELGESSAKDHAAAGLQAVGSHCDMVVFVGDEMKAGFEAAANSKEFKENGNIVLKSFAGRSDDTIKAACDAVSQFASDGDIILIKGSRGMGLERLTKCLEGLGE